MVKRQRKNTGSPNKRLQSVLRRVRSLTPSERMSVKLNCEFWGVTDKDAVEAQSVAGVGVGVERSKRSTLDVIDDENLDLFYSVMVSVLVDAGVRVPKHLSYLRGRELRILQNGWAVLSKFIDQNFERMGSIRKANLYSVIAETILLSLEEAGTPISLRTVLQAMSAVPELLSRQFPGYRRAGLLSLILAWGNRNAYEEEDEEDDGAA